MSLPDPERAYDDCERDHSAEAEAVRRVLEWVTSAGKYKRGNDRSIAIARRAIGLACFLYPEFYGSKKATNAEVKALGLGLSNRKMIAARIRADFRCK